MERHADLSPLGLARLIAELLDRLELDDVTLVGNDTGGALCQLVAAHHPERVGRLVLTNCDAFEKFPPPAFKPVVSVMKLPGAIAGFGLVGRLRPMRRASMSIMKLTVEPVPDALVKAWVSPLRDPGVRRDLRRVLQGISPEHTLDAAKRLEQFDRPTLLVWGMRDRFFPFSDAERLAATIPGARIERIENARTFVELDAPDRLAELVAQFAAGSRESVSAETAA
jgi:pimeloyl-ACP methyl ester carboxylesterase